VPLSYGGEARRDQRREAPLNSTRVYPPPSVHISGTSQPALRHGLGGYGNLSGMELTDATRARARARDQALRLLERLTVGASIAAVAGVGVFAAVSAATIPGTAASSNTATSSTSSTGESSSTSTSTSSNSSSAIQSNSGVGSSSSSGVAVSGGSR
jgi:hypothetical protein